MKPNINVPIWTWAYKHPIIESIFCIIVVALCITLIVIGLNLIQKQLKGKKTELFKIIKASIITIFSICGILLAVCLYINPIKGVGNYHTQSTFVVGIEPYDTKESTLTLIDRGKDDPYQIQITTTQARFINEGYELEAKTKNQIITKNSDHRLTKSDFIDNDYGTKLKIKHTDGKWIKPNEKG